MLKTNSLKVRNSVKAYLLEVAEVSDIWMIKDQFKNEYGWKINRVGEVNACVEWLLGLGLNVDYYYSDIAKRLAEWLEDTEENQIKCIEKKGDGLYWLLMAREICRG